MSFTNYPKVRRYLANQSTQNSHVNKQIYLFKSRSSGLGLHVVGGSTDL